MSPLDGAHAVSDEASCIWCKGACVCDQESSTTVPAGPPALDPTLVEACRWSLTGKRTDEDSADAVWSFVIPRLAQLPADLVALVEATRAYERSADYREPVAHWTRTEMRRSVARVVVQRVLTLAGAS